MCDNDRVPIVGRDAAHQFPPALARKIVPTSRKDVRSRIKGEQLRAELPQHVIRNNKHGLPRQPKPLQFHGCRRHRVGLARSDHVGEQGIGRLQNAPDARLLVRAQRDGGAGARQREVVAVEGAEPEMIELAIVETDQPLAAR